MTTDNKGHLKPAAREPIISTVCYCEIITRGHIFETS